MSHSKYRWVAILLVVLLALALLAACAGLTPEPLSRNSTGTGIGVASELERFYEQYGGPSLFGFPIINPFIDPADGRLVQYFQYFHLEFDQASRLAAVRPLGEQFAPDEADQTPVQVPENGPQRLFPETGFTVQDEFLTFYEANGDELIFGPPITPQLDEGGKLVQYFQNAQLIWNPNALPEFRVGVAPLGSAYLWQFGGQIDRAFGINNSVVVPEADVTVTLKEPILYAGETQVLYVSVISPDTLQLVEEALVSVTVTFPGQTSEFILLPTDNLGQTQGVLELPGVEPGQKVQIEVRATNALGTSLGHTTLSFKTWW